MHRPTLETTPLDREIHSGFLCLQHDSDERLRIVWLESMTTGLPQRDISPRVQLIFILVSSPGEQVNLLNEVPSRRSRVTVPCVDSWSKAETGLAYVIRALAFHATMPYPRYLIINQALLL